MEAKFSQRVKDVLIYSREEAHRLGNDYIGLEHLLLGIIREGEGLAVKILRNMGVDLSDLRKRIEIAVASHKEMPSNPENLPLIKQAERALKITYLEAKVFNSELIGTEHLLLAILKDENNLVTKTLNGLGITYDLINEELKSILSSGQEDQNFEPRDILPKDDDEEDPEESGKSF
jgi:ATP-dependent Clp protease ATP-binding subunit ClpC